MDQVTSAAFQTERNYGIDALRILSMLMVVFLHILGQGGILDAVAPLSAQYCTACFLESAAFCAVNCYALISGYVGICARYRYSNLVLLWLRVVFYTVLITVIFSFAVPDSVGIWIWANAFFPTLTFQYWYFTAYFCLFLFMPILNRGINAMSQKQLRNTVVVLVIIFSFLQTFIKEPFATNGGYSGLWLMILYVIGAYIRKYNVFSRLSTAMAFSGYGAMILITWAYTCLREYLPLRFPNSLQYVRLVVANVNLQTYISPTILFAAIFLLTAFRKMNLSKYAVRIVGFLSPLAFSVYLIHTHPLIWKHLMENLFVTYASCSAPKLLLIVILSAAVIFSVCTIIDFIRALLFRKMKIKEHLVRLETKLLGSLWNT